jgi:shikimate dehydrogenase
MRFAVIGDPIEHSRSPEMHLPVLLPEDPEATYEKILVKRGGLADWVERVKKENIRGFNITMPHKADIIPFLDGIEREAALFHSVNTAVNRGGKLYGYNTDGGGFLLSLSENGFAIKGKRLLLLGAGAAARTIAFKSALEGAASITILARAPEKARALCEEVKGLKTEADIACGNSRETADCAGGIDLMVNATPLGMEGTDSEYGDIAFLDRLPKDALVYDLIYEPAETKLLAEARQRGLKTQNGLKMLKCQALLADCLFLDPETDADKMCRTSNETESPQKGRSTE